MKDEFNEWRQRLYEAMTKPMDGKMKAFAASEKVSREWVRQVLDGTYEDVEMLQRCVVFLEKWNAEKEEMRSNRKREFVQTASQSPALAME